MPATTIPAKISHPPARRHGVLAVVAATLAISTFIQVYRDPESQRCVTMFVLDLSVVPLPFWMWARRPGSVHWAAGLLYSVTMVVTALLCFEFAAD